MTMKTTRKKSHAAVARRVPLDADCLALMRLVEAGRHVDVEAAARRVLGARPTQSLALKLSLIHI